MSSPRSLANRPSSRTARRRSGAARHFLPASIADFGRQPFSAEPSTPLQSCPEGQSVCSLHATSHCKLVVPSEGFPQIAPDAHCSGAPDWPQALPTAPPLPPESLPPQAIAIDTVAATTRQAEMNLMDLRYRRLPRTRSFVSASPRRPVDIVRRNADLVRNTDLG